MTNYYDAVLLLIPVTLVGIGGGLAALGYSTAMGALIGSLLAGIIMCHALFVNPPAPQAPSTKRQSTELEG